MRAQKQVYGLSLSRFIGLMLVPLTIIGVMLWGLWEPTARLTSVTAAVVNNDEPVEIDGQITPLGRVLAAELIGESNQNFTWVLTSEEDAEEGLRDARYVTVVTIPENFSAAATSLADGPAEAYQATINVATSERAKLLDTALAQAVTQTAARVINEQLGESFVGNIFVGMNDLKDGIVQIGDGAWQLADGGSQLAAGLGELANGTGALVTGAGQLAAGSGELASGTSEAARGTNTYAAGVNEFATGAWQLAAGSQQNADGGKQLAEGVDTYVSTLNGILGELKNGMGEAESVYKDLKKRIQDSTELTEQQKQQVLDFLNELEAAIPSDLTALLDEVIDGGNALKDGAYQSAGGSQKITDGIKELAVGADDLSSGAYALAGGLSQLADGAGQLAGGISELASGLPELDQGVKALEDGSRQSADGAKALAEGLDQVSSEMPNYNEAERDKMASLMLNPVGLNGGQASLFTGSGAPLFLAVALWAGGLVSFMLINPLWRRAKEAAYSDSAIALKSSGFSIIGGSLQGLIAGTFTGLMLGLNPAALLSLIVASTLAGVTFALINQGLVALFGGYGRFISFLVLTIGFVVGIISTTPKLMQIVAGFTPLNNFSSMVQNVLETSNMGFGAFSILLLWAALGFVLTLFAVRRLRRVDDL